MSREKGARAEREAAALLAELTGWPVRRALGAGRYDDIGDLDGIPDTVIQVRNYGNIAAAVRSAKVDAERQAANAGVPFGVGLVRHPGGDWSAVMTVPMLATLLREATRPDVWHQVCRMIESVQPPDGDDSADHVVRFVERAVADVRARQVQVHPDQQRLEVDP